MAQTDDAVVCERQRRGNGGDWFATPLGPQVAYRGADDMFVVRRVGEIIDEGTKGGIVLTGVLIEGRLWLPAPA